jgi:glutamate:Na+ symporter, ESS family
MSPEIIAFALVLLGLLLLLGKLVRLRWGPAQRLFLPASVIAGAIGLLLGPYGVGAVAGLFTDNGVLEQGLWTEEIIEVWEEVPGLLISVVFATLFLGHRIPGPRRIWAQGGPQLAFGVVLGAGQYVVGLILALAVLTPVFGLDPMAGALIEIGFEGGHGTAAGLSDTFEGLGWEEGTDLALGMATVGIVSGVLFGVVLVNWGARRGRANILDARADIPRDHRRGIVLDEDRDAAVTMTVRSGSIDPLTFAFAVTAVAIAIGQAILSGLQALEAATWGQQGVEIFEHVPLFPLAMLGGALVQLLVDRVDDRGLVDRGAMLRLQGFALDVLIAGALASLALDVIGENLVPFLLLGLTGIVWCVGLFIWLAPRIIPSFAFERGLTDFGQSMGVTATGLILLRIVDPNNESPALEAFGYKQLGFEPMLGGGLITASSVPLIAAFGPLPFLGAMAVLMLGALALGVMHFGKMEDDPAAQDADVRGG